MSTEEKIREAAKQVFLEKGFDGATTRDIAEAAGMNIALMNYYFRSKEKLFMSIFEEVLQSFFHEMAEILRKPISLREKIIALIEHDCRKLKSNPSMVIFIMNEIHRDPKRMASSIGAMKQMHQALFDEQLQQEISKGKVRPISTAHLLPLITGSSQFLYVSKAMHMELWQMNEEQFNEFAEQQKKLTTDMVVNFLFLDETP